MRRRKARLCFLGLTLVVFLAPGCATTARFTAVDTTAVEQLLGLIGERLDVAPEVARMKWNTKTPIEDLPRERQILDEVARRATAYGLDPLLARTFFSGQIEASKAAQYALHAEWTASTQAPFAKVVDLEKDIRPVLDRMTPAMLRALAEALPVIQQPGGRHLVETQSKAILAKAPGGAAAVRAAVTPLLQMSK
jgi:chorismate mutase